MSRRVPIPALAPTVLAVVVLALAVLCGPISAQDGAAQDDGAAREPVIYGVDVSHHSGEVDWQQVVAAGYAFAYLKATEGVDGLDATFADHWRAVGETSMRRGAYHFYVTEDDPEAQAAFFIDTVGELGPDDLVPVVDVELIGHGTRPGLAQRLRTFLELLEARYGVKPMIYTSPNFWDAHLDDSFGDYPLWIAEYGTEEPRLPGGWRGWHLWQWAENHRVPGIEKDVDPNRLSPGVPLDSLHIGSPSNSGAQP